MLRSSVSKQVARWLKSIGAIRRSPKHPAPRRRAVSSALAAALASALPGGVIAADSDLAQQHFETGRHAFEAQQYQAALDAFDAALGAGMSGPAIHFNVGVTAYRLSRYERAQAEFTEVARTPAMAALAHYNLGLIDLQRARPREARIWFQRAQEEATDERLRDLAATQLAQLPSSTEERTWVGFSSVGLGYDDNVALVSNDDVLGVSDRADEFAELVLAVSGPLHRAWSVDAGVFAVRYESLDVFDQLVAQGGAHYRFDYSTWTNMASMEVSHTQLDGTGFENRLIFGLQGGTDVSRHWALRLRYRYSDVDGLNQFSGLDGSAHEAQVRLQRTAAAWQMGLRYDFENDSYSDAALSLRQHKVGVFGERDLAHRWYVGVELAQRFNQYKLDTHGDEDRFEAGLALKKQVTPMWRITARYDYANNAAKLAEFDYQRHRFWLGGEAAL